MLKGRPKPIPLWTTDGRCSRPLLNYATDSRAACSFVLARGRALDAMRLDRDYWESYRYFYTTTQGNCIEAADHVRRFCASQGTGARDSGQARGGLGDIAGYFETARYDYNGRAHNFWSRIMGIPVQRRLA